ncbi:MAG: hypothetical protein AMDU1_APLC00039G0003 [Thermoplasmatales archaeon A-plasma]|jgi:hypothetical protein|nr:MAG: hypothetical protein AMDU1_APLC00039G0003 [Thermoplasmatales archaeon A-plasma]
MLDLGTLFKDVVNICDKNVRKTYGASIYVMLLPAKSGIGLHNRYGEENMMKRISYWKQLLFCISIYLCSCPHRLTHFYILVLNIVVDDNAGNI